MKQKILSYINDKIFKGEENIKEETPLYSSGLLNSTGHLKLINYLERTFDVSIPMNEISIDLFDNVNIIVDFINQKKKGV